MTAVDFWLDKMSGKLVGYTVGLLFGVFFLNLTESQTLAWRFLLREEPPINDGITLVALDEAFAETYDYPEITPRDVLARIVSRVASYGPKVIGLDYKLLPADAGDPGYEALKREIAAAGNVVLASQALASTVPERRGTYIRLPVPPPEDFEGMSVSQGFVNLRGDPVETALLLAAKQEEPSRFLPSFALVMAARYRDLIPSFEAAPDFRSEIDWREVAEGLGLPEGQRTHLLIDYFGEARPGRPRWIAAGDLGRGPPEHLEGKIVLIGSTYGEPSGIDTFNTPVGPMRGIAVHASILDTLLEQRHLVRWGPAAALVTTVLVSLLVAFALWKWPRPKAVPIILGSLFIAYPLLAYFLFVEHRLVVPMATPMKGGFVALILLYAVRDLDWPRPRARGFLKLVWRLEPGEHPDTFEVSLNEVGSNEATPNPPDSEARRRELVLSRPGDPWPPYGTREQALTRYRRGDVDPDFLRFLGYRLFQVLSAPAVEADYRRAVRRARWTLGGVRLWLDVRDLELARMPWELLCDRAGGPFLAARRDVVLARLAADAPMVRSASTDSLDLGSSILELLFLVCAEPGEEIDVAWEEALLRELEDELRKSGAVVRCTHLVAARPTELEGIALERFHVVHAVGPAAGHWARLAASRLLVLDVSRPPALEGPAQTTPQVWERLGACAPAVVVTPSTMRDRAALLFFETTYREMAAGRPVEEAVAAARQAVYRTKPRLRRDFAVPVLYLAQMGSDSKASGSKTPKGEESCSERSSPAS